jgi:hypothetical protein
MTREVIVERRLKLFLCFLFEIQDWTANAMARKTKAPPRKP